MGHERYVPNEFYQGVVVKQISLLVLNGPNLGVLGQRQPAIYGSQSMADLPQLLHEFFGEDAKKIKLDIFQSNSEGALIDRLELAHQEGCHGIVINAGALTHTSLALADCLAWIELPCIEVHLSNVWARQERIRHTSLIARHCQGVISGFGLTSYVLAIIALTRSIGV